MYNLASVTISDIDDVSSYATEGKLLAYASLVPRQGYPNRETKQYIIKQDSPTLRFIPVNAAYVPIKHSKRLRSKDLSIVRGLGAKKAIIAIVRILIEVIYIMLNKDKDLVNQIRCFD